MCKCSKQTEGGRTYREQKGEGHTGNRKGMMADLQKYQDQGTTEQHPGDLEKNAIFKETKAKRPSPGAAVHPWSGEGKADEDRGWEERTDRTAVGWKDS